jgi:GT2 family glycosyltransferase
MMSTRVSTSIIIPAHGHAGMTDHCVQSVLASIQDRTNVEIIVVDDASPQPIELAATRDERVVIARSEENLRFSRACNFGASRATGTFLVFLNNDTEVRGAWLTDMVACAETRKDVAVVGARLTYSDGTIQHAGVAFSQSDGLPRHIYRGFQASHPAVSRDRELQAVTGACMLVRRDAFDLVRGFDETFANGYEDIDLCLRLQDRDLRTWYCGTTDVVHLESVSRRPVADQQTASHDPNAGLFAARWHSRIRRDELSVYAEDGLITVESSDVYPVRFSVTPELGTVPSSEAANGIAELLDIRSRQVFDLEKEVGYLTCRLLDKGIEP